MDFAVLQMALLGPYIGWGVYALHRRFRYHETWPPSVEAGTLLLLVLFYAVQIEVLRPFLRQQTLTALFAFLGLMVSGVALYGHMAISLTSRFIVEFVAPDDSAPDRPRLGPAQALERRGDFEGALQEYLVLARIFPRDPEVSCCAAECLVQLKRNAEALIWFQRALRRLNKPEGRLPIVRRMCEIHERDLGDRHAAARLLQQEVQRNPDAPLSESLVVYMKRLQEDALESRPSGLDALEDAPLSDSDSDSAPLSSAPPRHLALGIDKLEDVSDLPKEESDSITVEDQGRPKRQVPGLEPME